MVSVLHHALFEATVTVTDVLHACLQLLVHCTIIHVSALYHMLFTTGKALNVANAYRAVLHCSDWHGLGILLNVDYNTLKEISSSIREGPSACKSAMLDAWLKGNVNASWRQLADALKDMGDLRRSQAVEKEYC